MFNFEQYKLRFRNVDYDKNYCGLTGYSCLWASWNGHTVPTKMYFMPSPTAISINNSNTKVNHYCYCFNSTDAASKRTPYHQLYCSSVYWHHKELSCLIGISIV